jgi:surface carbohydrate biosynthesis protein
MKKTNIFLPIESYAREFDGKLLTAVALARGGYRVILADQILIRYITYILTSGIYIGKNMNIYPAPYGNIVKGKFGFMVKDTWYIDILKKNKHSTIFLEEEGGIFKNLIKSEEYLDSRYSPEIMHKDDYIAAWGEIEAKHYQKKTAYTKNVICTGHPRLDLYMDRNSAYYEEEANGLVLKYGNFILINTNFSRANNISGLKTVFSASSIYSVDDIKRQKLGVLGWSTEMHRFSLYVKLIFSLSREFPKQTFILRPHPGEREKTYLEIFNGIKNILVIRDDAVGKWIKACSLLIHNGCSTGLEGVIMRKPVICFDPIDLHKDIDNFNYDFGLKASEEKEVIELIKEFNNDTLETKSYNKVLKNYSIYLNNCKLDEKSYAVDRILNIVKNIPKKKTNSIFSKSLFIWCISISYDILNLVKMLILAVKDGNLLRYKSRKLIVYGVIKHNFNRKLSIINKISGSEIKAHYISKNCFIINP